MKNRSRASGFDVRRVTKSSARARKEVASADPTSKKTLAAGWGRPLTAARRIPLAAALLAASGCALWPFAGREARDFEGGTAAAAARVLSRAIRFDTTNPPGDERPLAEYLVSLARSQGIEAQIVPTPSEGSRAGRAAAWARVRGTGAQRPVVLLSHLDTVPAEEREWALDPFAGLVSGGHVVGRGALDAKGIAVVHLLALVELARSERPLARDAILLAVPDEETGGKEGSGFLVRERRELLGDAEYLLAEGGGILPGSGSTPDVWGVAFAEKSPCWFEIVARGRAGHGSSAPGDGAIPAIVGALARLRRMDAPLRVTPSVARMFAALGPFAAPEDRDGLADLERALRLSPAFRERFLAEPGHAALVRNTLEITVLRAGDSTNVVPSEARAEVDARLLPGESCPAFLDEARRTISDPQVELSTLLDFETRASPVDTELFGAIERVAARGPRSAVVVPRVIAGFTDAHWFRDLGIVAYGFVPRWLDARDTRGIHGPNERISLENLERGVRTTVEILGELDRGALP
jgi:acetylornithine deacetylase/succinyl-diaminopimelate desuccinylase-like protein